MVLRSIVTCLMVALLASAADSQSRAGGEGSGGVVGQSSASGAAGEPSNPAGSQGHARGRRVAGERSRSPQEQSAPSGGFHRHLDGKTDVNTHGKHWELVFPNGKVVTGQGGVIHQHPSQKGAVLWIY